MTAFIFVGTHGKLESKPYKPPPPQEGATATVHLKPGIPSVSSQASETAVIGILGFTLACVVLGMICSVSPSKEEKA